MPFISLKFIALSSKFLQKSTEKSQKYSFPTKFPPWQFLVIHHVTMKTDNGVEHKNRTIASVIERNKVRLIATMQLYDIGKVELFISDSLQTLWRGICSQNVLT